MTPQAHFAIFPQDDPVFGLNFSENISKYLVQRGYCLSPIDRVSQCFVHYRDFISVNGHADVSRDTVFDRNALHVPMTYYGGQPIGYPSEDAANRGLTEFLEEHSWLVVHPVNKPTLFITHIPLDSVITSWLRERGYQIGYLSHRIVSS